MGTQYPAIPDGQAASWCEQLTSPLIALRLVLTIALDREVAVDCLRGDRADSVCLWPSSLYGMLATEAANSRTVWDRCSLQIERSLGNTAQCFLALPPSSLRQLLSDGSSALSNRELAALLWAMLKQSDPLSESLTSTISTAHAHDTAPAHS